MNIRRFTPIGSLMLGLASLAAAQDPTLTITTTSPLPSGVVDADYSQRFAATGGTDVYTAWALTTGTLPAGLSLNSATGELTGTPTQASESTFTVRVTDTAQSTASQQFTLTVWVNPPPTPYVDGVYSSHPTQKAFGIFIDTEYPLTITGTVTLTFTPDVIGLADDPAIQFAGGGRTLNFTIEAGQWFATFAGTAAYQSGTVAGTIKFAMTQLQAGGQSYLPDPDPYYEMQYTIARSAPVITLVQVSKASPGFSMLIRGYSTPREMTHATFVFTARGPATFRIPDCTPSISEPCHSSTISFVVPLDSVFGAWYGGSSSIPFGSQFLYTQLFTVLGDLNLIYAVSATLQNSSGTSNAVSAGF